MGKAYIKNLEVQGSPYVYCDIVTMGGGSPPDRPQPQPPEPPLGIWGPGDPRPTLPIAGWNPGTGTWPDAPGGGGGGGGGVGQQATIIPLPAQEPPVPPPAGMSSEAVQVVVWMGPGTKPTTGWINPYVDASPPTDQTQPPPA